MSRLLKEPDNDTYAGRFAARLRELRLATGLTGQEFVESLSQVGLDVKARTYYDWETGRTQPPLDSLPALASAFDLRSIADLFPKK